MRKFLFWLMPAIYIIAGINHFLHPDFYISIMPAWWPAHELSNYASAVAEIILGIGLIPVQTRKISAWLIIAMLIVFLFVIHIPMVFQYEGVKGTKFWISVARLPLQFYLIWWAHKYTRVRKAK